MAKKNQKKKLKVNIRLKDRPLLCLARKKVILVKESAESLVVNFPRQVSLLVHLQTKILKMPTGIRTTQ